VQSTTKVVGETLGGSECFGRGETGVTGLTVRQSVVSTDRTVSISVPCMVRLAA